ncbi:copper chaperone PCu(A)C [Streptomyces sp. NPDC058611]|uniref:copper chaperone PCu(A)C n=1 Tax=unclassified Streptomyces TaxID=2593676 RepID=UPI00364DCEE6
MTGSPFPAAPGARLPGRRWLREATVSVLAPVTACLTALVCLTAWAAAGAAGTPPRMEVGVGRVVLPFADKERTAAFFSIANVGGADDQLLSVTSPAVEDARLSRHTSVRGADASQVVASAEIPAGRRLDMTPSTLDVLVTVKGRWQVGDVVHFVLHFRTSGAVPAVAFVVRPGS